MPFTVSTVGPHDVHVFTCARCGTPAAETFCYAGHVDDAFYSAWLDECAEIVDEAHVCAGTSLDQHELALPDRTGLCVCGLPVAAHFDLHNRKRDCRWAFKGVVQCL